MKRGVKNSEKYKDKLSAENKKLKAENIMLARRLEYFQQLVRLYIDQLARERNGRKKSASEDEWSTFFKDHPATQYMGKADFDLIAPKYFTKYTTAVSHSLYKTKRKAEAERLQNLLPDGSVSYRKPERK